MKRIVGWIVKEWRMVVLVVGMGVLLILATIGTRTLLIVPDNKSRIDEQQFRIQHQQFRIEQQQYIIQQLCANNNEQDRKQRELWDRIFALTADDEGSETTPEEREAFRLFINDTFMQEACS